MLALLFDSGFWYDLIFIVLIAFVIFLCFKYPNSRVYVFSFLGIIFVGLTAYCGIQLNYYYTAEGGVWGYITGLIRNNTVTTTIGDTAQFSLQNIVLTQDPGGTYSATIYSDDKIQLEADKTYGVYVNNEPCTQVDSSTNYIRAEYHYAFLDNDLEVITDDTLQFNFAFYTNGSTFILTTHGGQDAVNYWNNYFSRNNLTVEVKPINYQKDDELTINGQYDDYVTLNYYVDNELTSSYIYPTGANVTTFATAPDSEEKIFGYWTDEDGTKVESLTIIEDTNLYAHFYSSVDEVIADNDLIYTLNTYVDTSSSTPLHHFDDYADIKNIIDMINTQDLKALVQLYDGSFYLYDLDIDYVVDEITGFYRTGDNDKSDLITINNYKLTLNLGENISATFNCADVPSRYFQQATSTSIIFNWDAEDYVNYYLATSATGYVRYIFFIQ